jgi:glutathione synthase/RimK-type ligase-like ATP-grasp enzyme
VVGLPTVIIISGEDDPHSKSVVWEIEKTFKAHALVLDSAEYPSKWKLSLHMDDSAFSWSLKTDRSKSVDSEAVRGVWWRRPNPHRIAETVTDPELRRFCVSESSTVFMSWLTLMGQRVMNPMFSRAGANYKPYQLATISEVGFKIPKTLCSNDPVQVRDFYERLSGKVIYKILTSTSTQFAETHRLTPSELKNLDTLCHAPAIFQEEISGGLELRATVVDSDVFTVSVVPNQPGAEIDWRLDPSVKFDKFELETQQKKSLIDLCRRLGLRYGAIDLRLLPNGEMVFFEVNPGGQFLFAEIEGKLPISRAVAAALLGENKHYKS